MNPNVTQQQADQFADAYRKITAPVPTPATSTVSNDFAVTPTKTVPSSALTYSGSTNELENTRRRMFDQAIATQEQFANQLTPSETETNLQGQLVQAKKLSRDAQRTLDMEQERLATSGNLSGEQAQAFSSDTARRMARTLSDYGNAQQGIADALQAEVARRTATGDMLSKNYQMQKENIALLGDMAKASIPNVIGSPFTNALTGDVFVYTQDPTTGEIKQTQMGNVGPSKAETGTNQWNDIFAGMPTSMITKLTTLADNFGEKPTVKRFIAASEAANIVNAIPSGTKNPLDHQQLIYAFAKSMDPDSAVREGEYDTILKLSQSLVNRYGKSIENAIYGTGILSEKAIAEIKNTITSNYATRQGGFKKAEAETKRILNNVAGSDIADKILQDYDYGSSVTTGMAQGLFGGNSQNDPLGINSDSNISGSTDPLGINQ